MNSMFMYDHCKGRRRELNSLPMRPIILEHLGAARAMIPKFRLFKHRSFGQYYFELEDFSTRSHFSFHTTQAEAHMWALENME